MKNKTARVLAIIALVFMAVFVVALTMTIIDYTMLHSSIGYVALGSGVFVLVIFLALKADGRGVSITKMNNEIEMQKIEKELAEQQKSDSDGKEEDEKANPDADEKADTSDKSE